MVFLEFKVVYIQLKKTRDRYLYNNTNIDILHYLKVMLVNDIKNCLLTITMLTIHLSILVIYSHIEYENDYI